jgi:hypothetical protein
MYFPCPFAESPVRGEGFFMGLVLQFGGMLKRPGWTLFRLV